MGIKMLENEAIFLKEIPSDFQEIYQVVIKQIRDEFPRCLIKFTDTKKPKDCRIMVGGSVAAWFWWSKRSSEFKVLFKLKKSSFFKFKLNSLKDSSDNICKSEAIIANLEDAEQVAQAIVLCAKEVEKRS
jgi:hypothetical protein